MLDIIIPTYKNKEQLIKTLISIPNYQEIKIIVVDDGSHYNYSDIQEQFDIRLIEIQQNGGPGVARQIGLMLTHEPYVLFLDSGDTLIDNMLAEALGVVYIHPEVNVFCWQFENSEAAYNTENNNLHGKIYKREFLEKYNISFSEKGSYANEDVGFNHICRLITLNYYQSENTVLFLDKPLVEYDNTDMSSLTRRENRAFIYKYQNNGLAYNAIHAYNIAKADGVDENLLKDYASDIMGSQYYYFLRTLTDRPEYLQYAWEGARYFYMNLFKNIIEKEPELEISYRRILMFYKRANKNPPKMPFNIKLFMRLLEQNEAIPDYYKTLAQNLDVLEQDQ